MKKYLVLAVMLLVSAVTFAQDNKKDLTGEAFFIGQWELSVEGLPTGDAKMLLTITKNEDGSLSGGIGGMDGAEAAKLTRISVEENTLTVNFNGNGFDVPLYLDKEEDGTVSGSMNDMFDVTGKRYVKEEK